MVLLFCLISPICFPPWFIPFLPSSYVALQKLLRIQSAYYAVYECRPFRTEGETPHGKSTASSSSRFPSFFLPPLPYIPPSYSAFCLAHSLLFPPLFFLLLSLCIAVCFLVWVYRGFIQIEGLERDRAQRPWVGHLNSLSFDFFSYLLCNLNSYNHLTHNIY